MNTGAPAIGAEQIAEILDRVKSWPATQKIALAKGILDTFEVQPADSSPRGRPVEELIGIGAGSGPPPDDEQVRSWMEEHRREKYG